MSLAHRRSLRYTDHGTHARRRRARSRPLGRGDEPRERAYVVVRKATKEYGTGNRIEGELEDGEEIAVLEDIATTGKSALDAVGALREAGACVSRVLVVVDREEGARERLAESDVELEALLTASDLLDAE